MKRKYEFKRGCCDVFGRYTEEDVVIKIDEDSVEIILYKEMPDTDEKYISESMKLDKNTLDKLIKIYELDSGLNGIK